MAGLTVWTRRVLRSGLLRNLGWFGLAELAARVSRLFATVLLARSLGATEFGIAAAALTVFEIIRTLPNTGIGQAVVRTASEQLADTCASAYRIGWAICVATAVVQVAIGVLLVVTAHLDIGLMLTVLSGVYLFMAPGLVNSYLVLRAGRFRTIAAIATAQIIADNLLAIVLALLGFGAWALVLPKLLVAPIWMIGMRRAQPVSIDRDARRAPSGPLVRFSMPVLGTELLAAARYNVDNLLVAAILGIDALGLYYFVFNAGIGFSLSLTNALKSVLFPHLAKVVRDGPDVLRHFDRALGSVVLASSLLIAIQAVASFYYVPIVFGPKWGYAAPLVAIMCASAIARPVADAAAQLLRAIGRPGWELIGSLATTAIYLGAFALALPRGLPVAITVLAGTATLLQLGFAIVVRVVAARICRPATQFSGDFARLPAWTEQGRET